MSQVSTAPDVRGTADGVRVVLFGMPDAGKSSLLGALAQAAQTQEHVLNGRLVDKTHGLVELQRRLYEDRPRETLEEVAPFPVQLEPFPPRGQDAPPPPVDAVLIDCDGRVANKLISRKEALQGGRSEGALAQAVLDADTLVLVVDASSEPAVLKRDFGQFALFLRLLEQSRGQRAEVGGLPVYLILTKCDLLAQPADTTTSWMDRIEERKRQVDRGFQEFLAKQAEREHMPFGKVELHLWATAVKRPALADAPARPREPYGVAELFRQCLASGATHRQQRRRAESRLKWTVGLVGAVVGVMALLAGFLFLSQPAPETGKLVAEVTALKEQTDPRAEKRLREPLDERLKKLQEVSASKHFPDLPRELQDFVVANLDELTAYRAWAARVWEAERAFDALRIEEDPQRAKARDGKVPPLDEKALGEVHKRLDELFEPPLYRDVWAPTQPARDAQARRQEVGALAAAVRQTREGYRKLPEKLRALKDLWMNKDARQADLEARAKGILAEVRALPQPKGAGKKVLAQRTTDAGVAQVTAAQVFRVESVQNAYDEWTVNWNEEWVRDGEATPAQEWVKYLARDRGK
jgi:hypothetical protein